MSDGVVVQKVSDRGEVLRVLMHKVVTKDHDPVQLVDAAVNLSVEISRLEAENRPVNNGLNGAICVKSGCFEEALHMVKLGHKVRRAKYPQDHVVDVYGMAAFLAINPSDMAECLAATDWEIVK